MVRSFVRTWLRGARRGEQPDPSAISAVLVARCPDLEMLVPSPPNGGGQKSKGDKADSAEAEMSDEEFKAALMSL